MNKSKKNKSKQDEAEKAAPATEAPEAGKSAPEEPAPVARQQQKPEDEALEMRFLRLQADFDNYRKRVQRERGEWQRQAREDLLNELLPVLDHFELGLNTAASHHVETSVMDGLRMVYDQFVAALRKYEVVPVEAEGAPFDHNLHEAITFVPSDEHPAQTVIAQTRRGYLLGEKLLRAAQVVVSSGPAEQGAAAEETHAEEEENSS